MQQADQDFERRMPTIEVSATGATFRLIGGGPVTHYPPDVWKKIIDNAKAGKYDLPK